MITASVGNTLEELVEAVRLVAEGKIRVVVDSVIGLEDINKGIERLRRGEAVGRVVVNPAKD